MKPCVVLFAAAALLPSLFGADEHQATPPRPVGIQNASPLAADAYPALPLTSVKPRGWLLNQLRLQADGLSGHLDEFWPDVGPNSAWVGGSGEGWERGPYFLDGVVPLAYLLDDPKLKAKVQKWVNWTLDNQRPDGGLGPAKNSDWWPIMIMLKVLTQYQEATGDARVIPAMSRYFAYQAKKLDQIPLKEWAIYRWHDEALSVIWLYNRTKEPALLELLRMLHDRGHDWEKQFADFPYTQRVPKSEANLATHGVNNAMALKAAAVWYLVTGSQRQRENARLMLQTLDRYHGIPNHMFSSDEHYAGPDPSQGVELCAVVEAMFSLEQEISILGDARLGDRLEQIAYNALPATISPDMWSHQYDQQPNQILCTIADRNWATNGPESNLFGLEPNFGCCTANMHQGWPKFAANAWMSTRDEGLAAIVYAPTEVRALVRGGVPVTITEETEYPFRDTIRFAVQPARTATFPLSLRVPAWSNGMMVLVNGQAVTVPKAGAFMRIERAWNPGDRVEVKIPMTTRASGWYHRSIAIERGPLVFALPVKENWHKIKQTGPAPDYEIYPGSPWNYALALDPAHVVNAISVTEAPLTKQPFAPDAAPVRLKVSARRLSEWQLSQDSAGPLPFSPVTSKQPVETITLVPYGAARLRVTAFPWTSAAVSQ